MIFGMQHHYRWERSGFEEAKEIEDATSAHLSGHPNSNGPSGLNRASFNSGATTTVESENALSFEMEIIQLLEEILLEIHSWVFTQNTEVAWILLIL